MQLRVLDLRLTHRYIDAYSYEDKWQHLGLVAVTPPKVTRYAGESDDFSDGPTEIRWVSVPPAVVREHGPDKVASAIRSLYQHQGCHHEYDCCGCPSVRATTRRVGRNRWMVRCSTSYNY